MIKNQDFIFLKKKRALKEFDKIYDRWIEMNKLYYKVTEEDFPGWYTESACTSILSGAVWSADTKSEFVALKEFQHDKKQTGQKKRKAGRADLYIGRKNKEYICEAKLRDFFIGERRDFSKRLKTKLIPAAKDLNDSWDKDHFHFGLAITFLNLWGRPGQDLKNQTHKFIEDLKKSEQAHSGAIWLLNKPYIEDNHATLGMALIVNVVKPE